MVVNIPHTDYIIGLADLTGELGRRLMRDAINSAAAGNTKTCFSLLNLLHQINEGFSKLDKDLIPRHVERGVQAKTDNVFHSHARDPIEEMYYKE